MLLACSRARPARISLSTGARWRSISSKTTNGCAGLRTYENREAGDAEDYDVKDDEEEDNDAPKNDKNTKYNPPKDSNRAICSLRQMLEPLGYIPAVVR